LWHGLPLKKIQKDNIHDRVRNPRSMGERLHGIPRRISDEKPGDYVLTASEFFRQVFSSAFNTGKVLVCGYPRFDMLTNNAKAFYLAGREKELKNSLESSSGRVVLYMPTFRESECKLLDVMDFEDFSSFLKKENIIFCLKLHHKSRLRDELIKYSRDNIITADPDADPYPLCSLADILVTDYSSIYFDYLLTDRPIIFFPYDYEEYISASRELYFDYNEFTPGIKVRSMEELKNALTEPDTWGNERKALREKLYNGTEMKCCSERLLNMIAEIIR
jgi:CDP-glycerol glycerophosphotransferase (TagB/SpsB family)